MKFIFMATVFASTLFITRAQAAPLTKEEALFVTSTIVSMRVVSDCSGYEVVNNGIGKVGDKMGVDVDKLIGAITAGLAVLSDSKYERAKLIPEVTNTVRELWREYDRQQARNKTKFCNDWAPTLIQLGFIQKADS